VDRDAVDAAVVEAFDRVEVVRFYADPPFWQDDLSRWSDLWHPVVQEWWTHRDRPMVAALERLHTAIYASEVTHDGDSTLANHVGNARIHRKAAGILVRKDRRGSPRKIDAAVAATLAYEARADCIAAGQARGRGAVYSF
jgi:hypothetical protein